eukprot:1177990-Pyramimonas_sp.AAC.1
MSNIALISRSELFLVISSIFLVFAELLLEPSSIATGVVIPASTALPGALFAAAAWLRAFATAALPGAAPVPAGRCAPP